MLMQSNLQLHPQGVTHILNLTVVKVYWKMFAEFETSTFWNRWLNHSLKKKLTKGYISANFNFALLSTTRNINKS